MPHKGLLLLHNSTMVSLNNRICRPETPEKHGFGSERGRHASVRADTLGNGSHAPQDAWGPQNAPKRPKIRRKTPETGVLGPGPPSGPATVRRCGVHCSAVYTCKNHTVVSPRPLSLVMGALGASHGHCEPEQALR